MEGSASSLLSKLEPNAVEDDEEGYDMDYESLGKSKKVEKKKKKPQQRANYSSIVQESKVVQQKITSETKEETKNEEIVVKTTEEEKVYDLNLLLKRLNFEKHHYPHILNVYIFGSRAYSQSTASSDTYA